MPDGVLETAALLNSLETTNAKRPPSTTGERFHFKDSVYTPTKTFLSQIRIGITTYLYS